MTKALLNRLSLNAPDVWAPNSGRKRRAPNRLTGLLIVRPPPISAIRTPQLRMAQNDRRWPADTGRFRADRDQRRYAARRRRRADGRTARHPAARISRILVRLAAADRAVGRFRAAR